MSLRKQENIQLTDNQQKKGIKGKNRSQTPRMPRVVWLSF